ncbi:SdiA-regulated domain-containing protein [Patulibacter americanus]|uniref:SdiA-regulated domain-containing protein n=1 Tax=Patulibacter americanus TaxID=588672 RepID=UPI0003B6398E|nr:SdiA-regulated domain-containing protein [Patulibacter americanus]
MLATAAVVAAVAGPAAGVAAAAPLDGVDLSTYQRVGRYDLPTPATTTAPAGSELVSEASGVTYDAATDSLFVVGDEGTSVVRVSRTGKHLDSMTLAPGAFEDTEGIAAIGDGRLVITEERTRTVSRFTYVAGGTLRRTDAETVVLATTTTNVGIEGITNDPVTGGFVAVKEKDPRGIFATTVDFVAGTASNGSATTQNPADLFDPAKVGTSDLSDVYALANVASLTGADRDHLLVISQETGRVVEVDRAGTIDSTLTIVGDPANPLSVPDQTHEGVAMADDGTLFVVNEGGGGDGLPQLWVYAPSSAPNAAPTAVTLSNPRTSLPENTSVASRLRVADVVVADDGLGSNGLTVTGPDAAAFEVDSTGLYLKAGTRLDHETKASCTVSVAVDDPGVGATPDATSAPYTLLVTDVPDETVATPPVTISEAASWGNDNATYKADWFEITNTGTAPVDLAGWRVDDDSNTIDKALPLQGVGSLAPGESAVFVEGTDATVTAFKSAWFGGRPPAGLRVGTYSGSGIGFGAKGDQINLFDATGAKVTGVALAAATPGITFDNGAGLGDAATPPPTVSTLSAAGRDGAFVASGETGSPGVAPVRPAITEIAPWGNDNSTYKADWFELTNRGRLPLDLDGWKVDDDSNAAGKAVALTGVDTLGPGESAVFVEGDDTTVTAFSAAWFGADRPAGVRIGSYTGSGIGLSAKGDQVNLFDATGAEVTGVTFGAARAGTTFDNAAGFGDTAPTPPTVSALSIRGRNGAYTSDGETGSPATVVPDTTGPTVTFRGNRGVYGFDERIEITCSAVDEARGSGVASTTCETATGPAGALGAGHHELTATATDHAGNVTTTTVDFVVLPPLVGLPGPAEAPSPLTPPGPPAPPAAPAPPKAPKATLKLARSVTVAALRKGVVARFAGLRSRAPITVVVRRGGTTLKTIRATAGRNGTRRLTVRLSRTQLAKLRGRTLTLKTTTVGVDGRRKTLTSRLRVR